MNTPGKPGRAPASPPAPAAGQLVTPPNRGAGADSAAAGRAALQTPSAAKARAAHVAAAMAGGAPAAAPVAARQWTPEQQQIFARARAPLQSGPGYIVRTTSGAGTGKTTTIEGVAQRLVELGHTDVRYVAFNKVAANEAMLRFSRNPACAGRVLAKTSHSVAFGVLGALGNDGGALADVGLEQQLKELLAPQLGHALMHVPAAAHARTRGQLVFYVRKTLEQFVHSAATVAKGLDEHDSYNTYFPARLYHEGKKGTPPRGLPNLGANGFYVRCARLAWGAMSRASPAFFSYDSVIKQAQLAVARIDGASALLVDESQDLNAAQVSWLSAQTLYGTDVFFVGDAAQTIYSFRGAKAKYISQLGAASRACEPARIARAPRPVVHDVRLTVSFRFGPQLAAAANAVLLSKRLSAQTARDPAQALWTPYFVTGGAAAPGRVLATDLVAARAWENGGGPITVIARSNVELIHAVLPVLAGGADGSPPPRVAVLGEGEHAGVKLWRRVLREIDAFCAVFAGRASSVPLPPWKAEAEEARAAGAEPAALNWSQLKAEIALRELQQYGPHVALVERHGERLRDELAAFERDVLEAKCAPDACDLLLTTVHQAKGLEWDTVQLADDFCPLARFAVDAKGGGPRFDWPSWGDDLNLWYVAITRAKRTLAVRDGLPAWLADMETIRARAEAADARAPKRARAAGGADGGGARDEEPTMLGEGSYCKPFSAEEVRALHRSLYVPWRAVQAQYGALAIGGGELDDDEA